MPKLCIDLPVEIEDYHPELHYFLQSMVNKLHINRHKGFADGVDLADCLELLKGEMDELKHAAVNEGQFETYMEAVDVANMSWLLGLYCLRQHKQDFTFEQNQIKGKK